MSETIKALLLRNEALYDSGRLVWSFGPPDDPRRVTGLDVIVTREDRIAALHTFLDQSPIRR